MVAVVQITGLPAATSLNGNEQLEAVQAGVSVQITVDQIATFVQDSTLVIGEAPIVAGVVTFDLTNGTNFFFTPINADITSIVVNTIIGSDGNSFIWQTVGTGVTFSVDLSFFRFPAGGAPIPSFGNGSVDTYTVIQRTDWFGYVSGQDA